MWGMHAVGHAAEPGDHQFAAAAHGAPHVLPGERARARGHGEVVPQGALFSGLLGLVNIGC